MNAPICIFCKHCKKAGIKNPCLVNVKKCAKNNRFIVSTTRQCKDYEKEVTT